MREEALAVAFVLGAFSCGVPEVDSKSTDEGAEAVVSRTDSLDWDPFDGPGTYTYSSDRRSKMFSVNSGIPRISPGSYPFSWQQIPGSSVASGTRLAATQRFVSGAEETHVFARHPSGYVIHQWRADFGELQSDWRTSWEAPFPTNALILGSPAVSSTNSNTGDLDVYVVGTDNQIYVNQLFNNSRSIYESFEHFWSGYTPLGGAVAVGTSPSAISYTSTFPQQEDSLYPERDVFINSASGGLMFKYWKGGAWTPWLTASPNPFIGTPLAMQRLVAGVASIDVFVMGTDQNIYRNRMNIYNPNTPGNARVWDWSGYALCGRPEQIGQTDTTGFAVSFQASSSIPTIYMRDAQSGILYATTGECY